MLFSFAVPATAVELHDGARAQLDFAVDAALGSFRSDRAYAQATLEPGERVWSEGYLDLALKGSVEAWEHGYVDGMKIASSFRDVPSSISFLACVD